ncbi:hypothetical protein H4219_001386 [Mycoemilia scoparia]|uniref:SMP-30/Gluconolactonase/LRE-like region domain-containing protein n=1 Tax=Mycoemilia scoparia TaxID=417184 RepID=A0A9W8DW73_9FUNG|nr:hypothetical protein H4219_001386 [Mycoemilia scoparia]
MYLSSYVFGIAALASVALSQGVPVHQAKPLITKDHSQFGPQIEGTGVDAQGNVYAVNFNALKNSTGTISPKQAEFFTGNAPGSDAEKTWYNGIRFVKLSDSGSAAYLADVGNHQVVQVTKGVNGKTSVERFCGDSAILQPNDITVAHSNNRVFMSGMNYTADSKVGDGDLWTCLPGDKKAVKLGEFYRTNGIEISPDEKTLYLSESQNKGGAVVSNNILKFDLDVASGKVSNKKVFVDFGALDKTGDTDIDGMRCDAKGNLYVSRNGIGKVAKFTPDGKLDSYIQLSTIDFVGSLELGGKDGKTLHMVGRCKDDEKKGCVETFNVDTPGNAFTKLSGGNSEPVKRCDA